MQLRLCLPQHLDQVTHNNITTFLNNLEKMSATIKTGMMGMSMPAWKRQPWADSYRFFFKSEANLVWKWCLPFVWSQTEKSMQDVTLIYCSCWPRTYSQEPRAQRFLSSWVLTSWHWFYIRFIVRLGTTKTRTKHFCSYIQKAIKICDACLGLFTFSKLLPTPKP